MNTARLKLKYAGIFAVLLTIPATALGGDLTAEEIANAVSDRTYQGSMTDNAFAEYYAPDGSIRGDGYTGKWRTEANKMCFQYGDQPENCWTVETRDASMTMIKDGVVDGNGMLVEGNVHGY